MRVTFPDRASRATMQIGSGLSPSGWWNSKSTIQISRYRSSVMLHLPPQPAEHRVIERVDVVVAKRQVQHFAERHLPPRGDRQLHPGYKSDVSADAQVRLDADPVGPGQVHHLQRRLAPAVLTPVRRRELDRPQEQGPLAAHRRVQTAGAD